MLRTGTLSGVALHKGRIEALSDGLFAIVMTLLVLELKIPEMPKGTPEQELIHKLKELGPGLFAFVITFIISSAFWLLHHISFTFIRHTTRALCWINLIFLMFVSLLPFSTGLLAHNLKTQTGLIVYFTNQSLVGLGLLVHWRYALAKGLVSADLDSAAARTLTARISMLPMAFLGACVFAAIKPAFAMLGFLAGISLYRLGQKVFQR